jgi:hypothetical protein
MGGSAVRIGRPLSPVPGAAFGVQPPIPPMSPPIYGGGSAVRIGQPPVQQVFGGSAVRLGGAYSA